MSDLLLRPADPADLVYVAEVMIESRRAAYPAMPAGIHSDDEVRAFVGSWDLADREVWLADEGGVVVGFAALTETWLDFLYVAPDQAGHGIGSALVELAQARRPAGLGLWVFETNRRARDLYARHGFAEVEHTDGADNEEHQPDVRMVWSPGRDPVSETAHGRWEPDPGASDRSP